MDRQEASILVLLDAREQGLQTRLDIANRSDRYRMASSDVRRVAVDLDDRRLAWIELAPGKIRSQQQQHIAIPDGVIASGSADHPGHADVVGIVVLQKILAARRVGDWCLQSRRSGDHLIMRAYAAGTGVDCDRFTLVEDVCDLVEVRIARANERARC